MEAPLDLSPIGLFLLADWVVRSVMLVLVAASVGVWALALDRWLRVRRLVTAGPDAIRGLAPNQFRAFWDA